MSPERPPLAFYAAYFTSAWLWRMVAYAAVIYGAERFGGGRWSGLFYLCLVLPYLFSVYAGGVIDATSRKLVLQVTAAVPILLLAIPALLEYESWPAAGPARGWLVAAVIACYGVVSAFSYPAFLAAIPEVMPGGKVERAAAIINILGMLCHACGPLAVGALRSFWPWSRVFGALVVLAASSWLFLQRVSLPPRPHPPAIGRSEWSRLRELYGYCRGKPELLALLIAVAVFSGLIVGPLEVLAPLFAERSLAETPLRSGLFIAAGGLGLFGGAIAALQLIGRGQLGAWLCGSCAGGAALMVVMTWTRAGVAFPLIFFAGFLGGIFTSLSVAGIQARSPDALRGRILGLFSLILGATPSLGALVAGNLAESLGTSSAIRWVFSLVVGAFVLLYVAQPQLRRGSGPIAD